MLRRALALTAVLSVVGPAVAVADTGKTVTATGTGRATVTVPGKKTDASIRAAVDVARRQAIPGALADARDHAASYASAAGLTLGAVQSVTDSSLLSGFPPFPVPTDGSVPISIGPGGIDSFCGTVHQPVFRGKGRHRVFVRFNNRTVCFVPPYALATLTVTYTAT